MSEQRANQAIKKFSDALINLENEIRTSNDDTKSRNSVLLTFLLAFETFWKALKVILSRSEGIDVASPKFVPDGLLGSKRLALAGYGRYRKMIAHTYSEQQAVDIYERVNAYAVSLRNVHDLLNAQHHELF